MMMDHKNLSLEYDRNLINKILDDINTRYIILFSYVIRNDLFEDLQNIELRESYERVLILDDIFKGNITNFWSENFIGVAIDLGLFKNIRSKREFEQKEEDFIIKMGAETITIEQDVISIPAETLFLIIRKKFKFLTKRNFNLSLTRLKGVRCETTNVIHPFIFEIGEKDYTLSDDLYYILDQFGNIYQAIKIEVTIEGFYQRFEEIEGKINDVINIFDPTLNSKNVIKKINTAIVEKKDIIKYLKDQKIKLHEKFDNDKIDKKAEIYNEWNSKLLALLNYRFKIKNIDQKLIEIKSYYSGKNKAYGYLEFIERVSYNEEDIVDKIQESLLSLRGELMKINDEILKIKIKEIKLLNLDFERYILMNSDE